MQSTLHIYIENALKKYNMIHFLCLRLIKNVAIHNLNIDISIKFSGGKVENFFGSP